MQRNVRENRNTISPTQFVLLLQSVAYLGEKTLTRLLRHNALHRLSPEDCLAFTPDEWRTRYDLDPRSVEHLYRERDALLAHSAELARTGRAHGLQILTCDSLTYPDRVERYDDAPPPVLTALGQTALLTHDSGLTRFTFTTACSNGASPAALERQDRIASALVEAGGTPVTGHDRAPYQRLALAAQRRGRATIYVFDRGLREALGPEFDRPPFAAARIRDVAFDTGRDLALSPFRLDDHGLGANNRRRDRLVFALSDLVIALDVTAGGGMEAQCRRAHEQSIPVFVAPDGRAGNAALLNAGCLPLSEKDAVGQMLSALNNRAAGI